ncbi:class I SAM-dependent methyltransferase [Marinicella sediminis]|uniref:Class I SAM-dependent methyltransferase n=1 Tax=Marinicella sediminis TaxID=1792834 RepID=A0ABV7JCF8_9GAMM|nr:class I SAM-dependent methyltransferase [Marinicella sediminis]
MMDKKHWTAYWQTGVLTSLPNDFKENYDGELADFWDSVMSASPSPMKVLDVCTGNGAVAILLKEIAVSNAKEIHVTAVDASDINPQVVLRHHPNKREVIDDIHFIAGTLVEELDQKLDPIYDLIVSQYGIEYCDTEGAAKAISYLLKPQGRLVFVAHAADTAILSYMRQEEQVYQLFDQANAWEDLAQFGSGKSTVNGFKNRLNGFISYLKEKPQFNSMPLFNQWGQSMVQLISMPNQTLKNQRRSVAQFVSQYQNSRNRALDMLSVSDKLMADPEWYLTFEQHGLQLQKQNVIRYQGEHIAGHSYEFIKLR